MSNKRLEARVSGLVQGVSFRYYTQQKAISLGVNGWVRNESNGDVSLAAEGSDTALQQLLDFLRVGSPYAEVENVVHTWSDGQNEFKRFQIGY